MTRQAYGLDRIAQRPFPADSGIEALDAEHNQATLQNIRLWDWRALQDTLRQIQEIRTYYDFPDIDIDRYEVDGTVRQMMLAARELNVDKLPESSRNWINEKLIYTHGYGVTMNPVNGFTPEGLPALVLSDMPIRSTLPGHQGDAAGDLFRRADEHRRLREDAPEGVQLPAGRDQQPHVLRRQRRHRARRVLPPPADRARPRRPREAALQRRRDAGEPAVDAAQHSAARRRAGRIVSHLRSRPLRGDRRGRPDLLDAGRLYDVRLVPLLAAHAGRAHPHQLHAEQREDRHRRLRRHDDVLRVRHRGPDHRGLSRRVSHPVPRRVGDAGGPAQARAVSRAAPPAAGGRLRPVPHDQSGRVLQPRGSVDRRLASRPERPAPAGRAGHGAELRADDAARRTGDRVHRDPAVHARQPEQPDRLDRRAQRRRALRERRSSTTFRRRSWSTARCRSRRASIRTRSSPVSCRCGTSRARTCAAAA